MAKFDIENFRDEFLNLFKESLNAKIAVISAEKDDGVALADFTDDMYVADLNEKVLNFNQFILYSLNSIETTETRGINFSLKVTISFEVVFTESENGDIANNKILRYTRAMAELAMEHLNSKSSQISLLELAFLAPTPIQLNNNSPLWKVGGISISGEITG